MYERVVDLNDYSCLFSVMGLATFHLIFEEAKEKNNVALPSAQLSQLPE
jgi:hypothetical protein